MDNSVIISVFGDFRAKDIGKVNFSSDVKELLDKSDVGICNFEAPIECNGTPIYKSGPTINQSKDAPGFLIENGFNVALLANNHIMDYGAEGCIKTLSAFSSVIAVGAGMGSNAYAVRTQTVKGKKIGYLSVCQHEFGVLESKEESGPGVAWALSYDLYEIIHETKRYLDYLFVFPHAGIERSFAPLPQWRRLYKKYIDWGADGVIASHPHTPQGWEYYKERPICYSLGNFYFDELTGDQYWNKGLAAVLTIDNDIKMDIHNICFDETGKVDFDNQANRIEHNNYLNSLLKSDENYTSYIDKMCKSEYEEHKYGLLRGLSGATTHIRPMYAVRLFLLMLLNKKAPMSALNRMQCESHRWAIEHCLKKNF